MSTTLKTPVLVAITGGSGAGKSWTADRIAQLLGQCAGRIALDDFYSDHPKLSFEQRKLLNFDHPDSIDWGLFESILEACAAGRATLLPRYAFHSHSRLKGYLAFTPHPIIIFDGLWLLYHPEIRDLFHLKVYLQCTEETRLNRRIDRDQEDRGRCTDNIREQFESVVQPMHVRFVKPQARFADCIYPSPVPEIEIQNLYKRIFSMHSQTLEQST